MAGGDDKGNDLRGDEKQQPPHKTLSDVAKAHRWDDFKNVLKEEPCAREGLIYGIASGIGVGLLHFVRNGRPVGAGNWAVGTFAAVAICAKKLCHYQQAHQRSKARTLLEMQSKLSTRVKGFEADQQDGEKKRDGE
ncbi:hypothetical protein GGI15_001150 [Coemansia interrupta]|uniref:Cytochrome c oxidase assembly protein COX20, mitochondrial n=1 Tax=Coemansia interrupta TaxID=1126814 RepID=A0A9W8LP53_9FUNG|nr:hypothetical protein GGI15_001150 [Coemansia interrupta]